MRIKSKKLNRREIIQTKEKIKTLLGDLSLVSKIDVIGMSLSSYIIEYFKDIIEKDNLTEFDKIHLGSIWNIFVGLLSVETSEELELPENIEQQLESYKELIEHFSPSLEFTKQDIKKLTKEV